MELKRSITFINRHIPFRFLNNNFEAFFTQLVGNPFGHIFGGRIDIAHNIVHVFVIELAVNRFFDMTEVNYHAVLIKLGGACMNVHNPVVTVQVLTLAWVGQFQLMRGTDF